MRNFWYFSFLAVMYLFFSWAAEAFAAEPVPLRRLLRARREVEESTAVGGKGEETLIDTISLSYGGNYYVAETFKQVIYIC